jgi:hypothetical protein
MMKRWDTILLLVRDIITINKVNEMKTLSIKQPWSTLIVMGLKNVENRTWKTKYRGKVLIHAPSSIDYTDRQFDWCRPFTIEQYNLVDDMLHHTDTVQSFIRRQPLSAIIGEVDIIDITQFHDSPWAEHHPLVYNWILENPVRYDKPILNVKGKLNIWNYNN